MPRAHPFGRPGGRDPRARAARDGPRRRLRIGRPGRHAVPDARPPRRGRHRSRPRGRPSRRASRPRRSRPSRGRGRIDVASAGYGLTLPENWFRVDLTKEDLQAFAKAGSKSLGTDATAQLSDQVASLVASGISLFAYRFADAEAGLGTNLNVIVLPGLGLDLDTLERLNLGQLQGIVGPDVTIDHARETLPAGEAVRLAYTVPGSARTNGKAVAILQHLVLAGGQQLILTCTAPDQIAKIADECDGIAKSVEFLK